MNSLSNQAKINGEDVVLKLFPMHGDKDIALFLNEAKHLGLLDVRFSILIHFVLKK